MNKTDTEQMNNIIRQLKSGNMDFFDDFYELTKK